MAADQFKPGDVVCLKSGGPPMTVKTINPAGEVYCEWFDENGTAQFREFAGTSLDQYEEEDD